MTLYFRMPSLPIVVLVFLSSVSATSRPRDCIDFGHVISHGRSHFTVYDEHCTAFECFNGSFRIMYVGCHEFELCREVGAYTMDNCHLYQCRETRRGSTPRYTNILIQEGCFVNGKCYEIGQQYVENCHTYECVNLTQGDIPYSTTQRIHEGCQGMQGNCYALSQRLDCDCTTYECTKTLQNSIEIYSLSFVHNGCTLSGKCYGVGEQYEHDCHKYECIITTQDGIQHSINQRIQEGCNTSGNCYALGEIYQSEEDCHTYKCIKITEDGIDSYVSESIREGCVDLLRCYHVGDVYQHNCHTYECNKSTVGNSTRYETIISTEGCYGFDKCYHLSEQFQFDCHTYECTKVTKYDITDYIPIRVKTGCRAFGRCYDSGERFEHRCIPYTCLPTDKLPDGSAYYAAKPSWTDCALFEKCNVYNGALDRGSLISDTCNEDYGFFPYGDHSFFNATSCNQTRDCYIGPKRISYRCNLFQLFERLTKNDTNFNFLQTVLGECQGHALCNYTGQILALGRHAFECTRAKEDDPFYYYATLIRPGYIYWGGEPVNPGVTFSHTTEEKDGTKIVWRCVYQHHTAFTFIYHCQV